MTHRDLKETDALSSGVPSQRSGLTVHELDGEALVYDAATADTHRLNETALFIWRACDGRHDADGLAVRVSETYDVPAHEARNYVDCALEELASRNLVVYAPSTCGADSA